MLVDLPQHGKVCIFLYTQVRNAAQIRKQLASGTLECAFVAAASIYSPAHLLAAVYRAMTDGERMRTRNVHSEIVFCLSPANNIGDGLRRFGITDDTTELYAIRVAKDEDREAQILDSLVDGQRIEVSEVSAEEFRDLALIEQNYGLSPVSDHALAAAISLRGY